MPVFPVAAPTAPGASVALALSTPSLFPPLSEKGLGQPCLWFWMVRCEFWRAMGCRCGFPTGFQLWVELHRQWELWSAEAEQGQVFPKPGRAVPMAGAGPGPCESPSHLAAGLDQGTGFGRCHFALLWLTPRLSLSLLCSLPWSFLTS